MTRRDRNDLLQFAREMWRVSPEMPYHALGEFINLAKQHHHWCEVECCREMTENERARERRNAERIAAMAQEHGFRVRLDGDPRGATVFVLFANGAHNTWGGEEHGYAVPF